MRLSAFKALTRLEQTLFGLPFVISGLLLSLPIQWRPLFWVMPAFLLARISGMAFNQLIDRKIDARNPRTEQRPLPSGRVSVGQARTVAWGALILFLLVCFQINGLTAALSLLAALLLYLYSYMKRLHPSCHFVLGGVHFLGPVMAYAAMRGTMTPAVLFLGAAAAFSIIGNDIAYAIQDYTFDCEEGLYSIPSCLGIEKSITFSALIHCACLLMLLMVGLTAHLHLVYYLVIPTAGAIFWIFHRHLRQKETPLVFFCSAGLALSTLFFLSLSIVWDVLL